MSFSLREKRRIIKSAKTYIETQLDANFSGITTVLSFKQATKADKPCVCVTLESTEHLKKEIGSTSLWDTHLLIIEIFGTSGGQTQDIADFIVGQIKGGFTYYSYTKTNATDKTWTAADSGSKVAIVGWVRDERIDFGDATDESDQFRHEIACIVRVT